MLTYTSNPLDRNSAAREQPGWVEHQWNNSKRRVVLVHNELSLVEGDTEQAGFDEIAIAASRYPDQLLASSSCYYLGHYHELPVFAVDCSHLEQDNVRNLIQGTLPDSDLHDLRRIWAGLTGPDVSILAYARGLCYWHQQNCFCSRCGQPQDICYGGHMKRCQDSECGRLAFPHINPAVIMAVELENPKDGVPRCLLGRNPGLPKGMYSTLAGYVEIGESLEEAVIRETKEEAGVTVHRVAYCDSQPWPFPSSLMLGFHAATPDETIRIDQDELEDARWFTVQELESMEEFCGSGNLALPRKDSIARTLIQSWIDDNQ